MPSSRRPSKHTRPHRELRVPAAVERRDGRWIVREVVGAAAVKSYRCPSCHRTIAPGTPHIVAWPADPGLAGSGTIEERRHWHTGCWASASQGRR